MQTIANNPRIDAAQLGLIIEGSIVSLMAAGFATKSPWVTWLWPSPGESMTTTLLAALLASYSAASFYLSRSQDRHAAVAGGALAVAVGFGGFSFTVLITELAGRGQGLALQAVVLGLVALGAGHAFFQSKMNQPASAKAPLVSRLLLLTMSPYLLLAGYGLLAGWHDVLPWHVSKSTAMLVGWIFIGFSFNYLMSGIHGDHSSCGTLLCGMLVYDAAMIGPLLHALSSVSPAELPALRLTLCATILTGLCAAVGITKGRDESAERDPNPPTQPVRP